MSTALACIEGIKSLKTKKLEVKSLQEIKLKFLVENFLKVENNFTNYF